MLLVLSLCVLAYKGGQMNGPLVVSYLGLYEIKVVKATMW